MVLPLFVGRERSIEALEHAMAGNKQVLLVAQRHAPDDNPDVDDLYQVAPSPRFFSFSNCLMAPLRC